MEYRTGTERIDANYPIARRLVQTFPEKAVELIASTCEYNQINQCIAVASHSRGNNAPIVNSRNEYSALDPPYAPASSTSSQQSTSPKSPPIIPRFSRSRGNPTVLPPSPAPTSSTGQSSTRPEYINVPINGPLKECKLSMRTVSTEHSVIRQNIVKTRLRDNVHVEEIQNGPVHTPYQSAPNGVLTSYYQTQLTWRRDSSWKTHEAIFYLVQDDIDSDILLGEADSGEGFNTTMGAQSRGQHGTTVTGQAEMNSPYPQRSVPTSFFPHVPPPAPEAPFPASYHRSSAMDGSLNRTPVSVLHQGPNHGHPAFNDLNGHLGRQTSPNFSHHPRSRPLSGDMSQPRGQPIPGNASQVHEQGSPAEELRVEYTWDKACVVVKLDLNAPAENFLITLENKFKRFKKILDRNTHSIRFTDNKEAEGGYCLALEESNFIEDWESAIDWIRDNRRTKAPHLYAVIELEEG